VIKKLVILFCLALSFQVGALPLDAVRPAEIRIGMGPLGLPAHLKEGAKSIARLLQEELGVPVSVYLAKNYSNLAKSVDEKKLDFVFLSALSFVRLEKKAKIQVLLKHVWQEPFYYSTLIALKSSGIKNLADLKGKKIAFVDKKSTSGYLYPKVWLKKNNIPDSYFAEIRFSSSHSESVNLLNKKEVDAIFVFADDPTGTRSAWSQFTVDPPKSPSSSATTVNSGVEALWVSDPIPNDPFCVRTEFYEKFPKTVHALMYSLIDAKEKLEGKKGVVDILSSKGFVPATSRQYDPIREMVKELDLPAMEDL